MCPSYMATREEQHSTRGRANVLRLAMAGRLGEAGLGDDGVYETLDLCLECRACKAECPVGVDMARFKSEFLADYWQRHGTALACAGARQRAIAGARWAAAWRRCRTGSSAARRPGAERGRARHRPPAAAAAVRAHAADTAGRADGRAARRGSSSTPSPTTTTRRSAWPRSTCSRPPASARRWRANGCCGRPQISKGLLADARELARRNADRALRRRRGRPADRVLRAELPLGRARGRAGAAARRGRRTRPRRRQGERAVRGVRGRASAHGCRCAPGPARVLLHGHCHQKSMGSWRRRERCCRRFPARRSSIPTRAAAAWPARSATTAITTTCRAPSASGSSSPPCAAASRAPWSSPPAPPAAIRSTTSPASAVHPAVLLRSLLAESR